MFLKFSKVALNLSANQTVVDSWKVRMSHRIMVVEPNEVIVNFAADNAGITEGGIMMLNDVLLERSHSEVKLVVRTSFANETGLQYKQFIRNILDESPFALLLNLWNLSYPDARFYNVHLDRMAKDIPQHTQYNSWEWKSIVLRTTAEWHPR